MLTRVIFCWTWLTVHLRAAGEALPLLVLRVVMGWEFFESGLEKLHGSNWFAQVHDNFPFPFNVIDADVSWFLATWFELVGGVMLWLGLGTRFVAFSLMFLTFVATAAVHWPDMWTMWTDLLEGYSISDRGHGNFKLPLLFVVMLLPLVFSGAGVLSVDRILAGLLNIRNAKRWPSMMAWALSCGVLGVPFLMLVPTVGFTFCGLAVVLGVWSMFGGRHSVTQT